MSQHWSHGKDGSWGGGGNWQGNWQVKQQRFWQQRFWQQKGSQLTSGCRHNPQVAASVAGAQVAVSAASAVHDFQRV